MPNDEKPIESTFSVGGRRYPSREIALAVFEALKEDGRRKNLTITRLDTYETDCTPVVNPSPQEIGDAEAKDEC